MFETKCKLLTLSDEVLLMILECLSTSDLIVTSRTCERLNRLCLDRKLMVKVVDPPNDYESMNVVFNRCINPRTTVVSISSPTYPNRGSGFSLSPSLLLSISPDHSYINPERTPLALTHLHLVRQSLDGRLFSKITMFPSTLKVLEFTGSRLTHITEHNRWFMGMCDHFTQLEELILKYCTWVTSHALLGMSKCPELIRLDLEGCRNVGNSIAYTALAARNGFFKLRILNLNNTDIRESDFQSFCKISTLEEFYFGKYYGVDSYKTIPDNIIAYCIGVDCKNLRVMDISGCSQRGAIPREHYFTALGMLFLRKELKLEKVFAFLIDPFPPNFIEAVKGMHPALEIYQTPLVV